MTDPSISPNSIVRCRVLYLSEDFFTEYETSDEGALMMKSADGRRILDDFACSYYEYLAPAGYEIMVGLGVLFENERHHEGCGVVIHVRKNNEWELFHID